MNDILFHRGPDGEGYFIDGFSEKYHYLGTESKKKINQLKVHYGMFLAHRRLSIIDLTDNGLQPFEMNGCYLVFNGEIYNYIELREELKELGHIFHTETDTEVILAAYHLWGSECSNRFNGMWAFSIYDSNKKQLFLSRDRFGIKPLYYYNDEQTFVFSSEIKGILAFGVSAIVNRKSLDNYLIYGLDDTTEDTFFEGIKTLKPSHSMIIDLKENPVRTLEYKYYSPQAQLPLKGEELYHQVRFIFEDSVRLRLRSDVEVGSCLSGGLDSSSIVAIAAKLHNSSNPSKAFQTYTTSHADPKVDETKYSKMVNEFTNTQGNYATFDDENFLSSIKRVVYHQEEPFSSFSIYASWKVMESAAKDDIKVLLDGQGGDEVFLGYEIYYVEYIKFLLKKFKIRELIELFKIINHRSKLNQIDLIKYLLYFSISGFRIMYKKSDSRKFLNDDYKVSIRKPINNFITAKGFKQLFHNNMYQRIQHLLKYEDRNSMAFSIETRLPFMDYRLYEIMSGTNPSEIFKDGWLKSILRTSMNGILPNEILFRKDKYGFHAPEEELLYKFSRDDFLDLINTPQTAKIYDLRSLVNYYDNKNRSSVLIKAVILSLWFREFNPTI